MQHDFASLMADLTLERHRALCRHRFRSRREIDPSQDSIGIDVRRQDRIPHAQGTGQATGSS